MSRYWSITKQRWRGTIAPSVNDCTGCMIGKRGVSSRAGSGNHIPEGIRVMARAVRSRLYSSELLMKIRISRAIALKTDINTDSLGLSCGSKSEGTNGGNTASPVSGTSRWDSLNASRHGQVIRNRCICTMSSKPRYAARVRSAACMSESNAVSGIQIRVAV